MNLKRTHVLASSHLYLSIRLPVPVCENNVSSVWEKIAIRCTSPVRIGVKGGVHLKVLCLVGG